MIKLENICKTFKSLSEKKEVLDGVNFEIEKSKITGFLGVNGSGKTTLIKIILQFISHNDGKLIYSDEINDDKGGYKSIGYLPERPYYYTNLTGKEFLEFTISLSKKLTPEVKKQYQEYTERLSVADALNRKLRGYSKGMLQKIGFISNLVSECKLLILDEPLSGLDLISREEYKKILVEYSKNGGSVFISSHIVNDLEEVADKIVLLDSKKIRYDGSAEEFFKRFEEGSYVVKTFNGSYQTETIQSDNLGEYLKHLDSASLDSIKKKRKSFGEYIKDIRNEF